MFYPPLAEHFKTRKGEKEQRSKETKILQTRADKSDNDSAFG